ncbi:MAG: nitroreductase family protein [Phycisphaerae bacterium]
MDVLTAIKTRRSVRSYSPRPIPADVLDRMRQALRYAPSACNFQPWHFIFVADEELRRKVARAANGQLWMAAAPLTIAACGFPDEAYKYMGGYGNSADVDVAIALDHLTLAAVVEGLGTCWIGAFNEERVKRLLEVPRHVKVVALTPLGYPASADLNFPLDESRRKRAAEIFSTDRYGRV